MTRQTTCSSTWKYCRSGPASLVEQLARQQRLVTGTTVAEAWDREWNQLIPPLEAWPKPLFSIVQDNFPSF